MKQYKTFMAIAVLAFVIFSNLLAQKNTGSAGIETTESARKSREQERLKNDWGYLSFYKNQNATLAEPAEGENRVVFYGNSITFLWKEVYPAYFKNKPYICRGIAGQTTPQMLVRFRQDVIGLKPKIVVILAGTNDIAGNTGPSTLEMIMDNLISMVELAKSNGIIPILCSVLPAYEYSWEPGVQPAEKIAALNVMIKNYADTKNILYVDYYSAMVDERKGLKAELCFDGVHPNEAGFKVMEPLVEVAIAKALEK
jgi:lysophospholipase L1-like esterase